MKVAWDADSFPEYLEWVPMVNRFNIEEGKTCNTTSSVYHTLRRRWERNKVALPQFKRDIDTMIFNRANFKSKTKTCIRMTANDIRKWLIEQLQKEVE